MKQFWNGNKQCWNGKNSAHKKSTYSKKIKLHIVKEKKGNTMHSWYVYLLMREYWQKAPRPSLRSPTHHSLSLWGLSLLHHGCIAKLFVKAGTDIHWFFNICKSDNYNVFRMLRLLKPGLIWLTWIKHDQHRKHSKSQL